MTYSIRKNQDGSFFPDISYAVYKSGETLVETRYKVSTKRLVGYDILENDIKYFSEKKFSDNISLDYLTRVDKESITEGASDQDKTTSLEKYNITLFPTLMDDKSSSSYKISYFGSILNPSYELITLIIPVGIDTVILYSSSEDFNNPNSGSIIINFEDGDAERGKQEVNSSKALYLYLTYNRPDSFLWKLLDIDDPEEWIDRGLIDENNVVQEYNDLLSITPELVGTIYKVESENSYYRYLRSIDFNLSYTCWILDNNGNPYMSDCVLRRDHYNKGGIPIKRGFDNLLYSTSTGSLVGTDIEEMILFERRCKNSSWNPLKKYGTGEKVVVGNNSTVYESLISGNIGNHPYYSNAWVIEGSLENFLNKQIQVTMSLLKDSQRELSNKAASITPYGTISIPRSISSGYSLEFSVIPNSCYKFRGVYSKGAELILDEDYYQEEEMVIIDRAWGYGKIGNDIDFCFSENLGKISFILSKITKYQLESLSDRDLVLASKEIPGNIPYPFYSEDEEDLTVYNLDSGQLIDKSVWFRDTEVDPNEDIGIELNTRIKVRYSESNPKKSSISKRVIVEYKDSEYGEIKYKSIDPSKVNIDTSGEKSLISIEDTYNYQSECGSGTYYIIRNNRPDILTRSGVIYPRYYAFYTGYSISVSIYNLIPDSIMVEKEYEEISLDESDTTTEFLFRFYTTDENVITYNGSVYSGVTIYYKKSSGLDWIRVDQSRINFDRETNTYYCLFSELTESIEIKIC